VPIRLAVQMPADAPPLRTGMSATVEIDTGHRRALGDVLASAWQFVGM
jgi:membrane fusion protein (multidrug efflux system)